MNFVRPAFLAFALALAVATHLFAAGEETSPQKGVADFRSLKELLDVIPQHVRGQLKSPKEMEAARLAANAALTEKAVYKWITVKIRVNKWEPYEAEGVIPIKYRVEAQDETVNVSGTVISVHIWVNLGADAEPIVTKLARGSEITVTSYLNRVELTRNAGDELKLEVQMARTKIKAKP